METVMSVALMGLFKMALAITGILAARAGLIWFDRSSLGRDFMARVVNWNESSQALYYGLRFAGMCLLVGLVLS